MPNPGLIKTKTADGAVAARRIVTPGASAGTVAQAAAATDALVGVSERAGGAVAGGRIDVIKSGIAQIDAGGVIVAGDPVTADAAGKAVTAVPAAGANVRIIGFAEEDAANGDYFDVLIAPGVMQG